MAISIRKYHRKSLHVLLHAFLFFCLISCHSPAVPDTESDFSGTIQSLTQYSTLGVEKFGVIQVINEKHGLNEKINVTITAKTSIVSQNKRKSFNNLKKGQQVKVWLKDKKPGFLNSQLTAVFVAVD